MREIKFRQWISEDIQQHTVAQMNYEPAYAGMFKLNDIFTGSYGEELMRSTGVKDKNEIEVYEGDFIKVTFDSVNYSPEIFEIKYGKGSYDSGVYPYIGFYCKNIENGDEDGNATYMFQDDYTKIEVIGNVYENEDLLKL